MNISAIKLFNILRKKLGDEESNNLVEFVHAEIDEGIRRKSDIFLTKDDKSELLHEINEVKVDLIDRMNKNKTEILVWIVGTGILQFLMVLLFKRL
jgi:hypothetical protein